MLWSGLKKLWPLFLRLRLVNIYRRRDEEGGPCVLSDEKLIEQIKHGDEQAGEELIRRYYSAILQYCDTAGSIAPKRLIKCYLKHSSQIRISMH